VLPVAQYVRMSTDHQKYSIANQEDRIARYAADHGMVVLRTYQDSGKSGVTIRGRKGLQELVRDVHAEGCPFKFILVFDVSRWGRFQDTDESAFYEYVCKRAGAPVLYCEEAFTDYDGPMTTVIKSIKRAMAAEFSRELGAKVFAGQKRQLLNGYWQGGGAKYGTRRQLVSDGGANKGALSRGDRKSLQADHVILVPGDPAEVRIVRDVFRWFVIDRLNEGAIALRLNRAGKKTQQGRVWCNMSVRRVVNSEIYVGTMVWNKTSCRLGAKRTCNTCDKWIRAPMKGQPLVRREMYDAAQKIIASRRKKFSEASMLENLRVLFQERGVITTQIVDNCQYTPWSETYRRHFGTLAAACAVAGLPLLAAPGKHGRRNTAPDARVHRG
jgi:DNA invertase Pin-like site-specific DNA recombinase